jgi:hypothetical protein
VKAVAVAVATSVAVAVATTLAAVAGQVMSLYLRTVRRLLELVEKLD